MKTEYANDDDNSIATATITTDNVSPESKALEPEQYRKLFIGGLSISTSDEALKDYYSQFGEVVDCIVMRDGATKKSRGFGFVSFANQTEVDRAMAARPHVIDNRTVDPKRAVPRDQSTKGESNVSTKRLFVSNIREEHSEEGLAAHFQSFGNVEKLSTQYYLYIITNDLGGNYKRQNDWQTARICLRNIR
jgi:RNA recognition motif-containing protein